MRAPRAAMPRGRGDSGAALVEFAIIMPHLFALFLGMFTGGISLSRKNSMTNAVREGARLGATLPEDADWAGAVRDRVITLSAGDLTTEQVCVQLVRKDSAVTETVRRSVTPSECVGVSPPPSAGVPVGQCLVKVWARRTSELQAVFVNRTLMLDAASIGRYERKGRPRRAPRERGDLGSASRTRRQRRDDRALRVGHGGDPPDGGARDRPQQRP